MRRLIEASHLNRSYGETHAVRDISLHVNAGEIYGLVGPDGAGKTTAIRLLCGALKPTPLPGAEHQPELAAQIQIAGYDLARQTEQARAQIGYLPQRFSLYEDLTVMENIRFFAETRGLSAKEWKPRCMEILGFVGLNEFLDRRAGFLSGGMKQKLGLAAALVHRPRVLLLDEPTTGVDPVTRQDFWQLIIRLVAQQNGSAGSNGSSQAETSAGEQQQGTAVLVSTPYMDEASRCTRIGFISAGKIIRTGTPTEMRSLLNGRVLELAGSPLTSLRRIAQADPQVEDVQMFGDRLHLRISEAEAESDLLPAVIGRLEQSINEQGFKIERLRPITPQLEDVFMSLLEAE